jgi:hypothetical protein
LADGRAGQETENREVVGGDRRGKETTVALVFARRRLGVSGEMIPTVVAAAAARMVVVVVSSDGDVEVGGPFFCSTLSGGGGEEKRGLA